MRSIAIFVFQSKRCALSFSVFIWLIYIYNQRPPPTVKPPLYPTTNRGHKKCRHAPRATSQDTAHLGGLDALGTSERGAEWLQARPALRCWAETAGAGPSLNIPNSKTPIIWG